MTNSQTWNPERYARNARFVADLGMPVVELLAARQGECILDLGCGDGVLTLKLAAKGCHVIGVDGSMEQVSAACKLGLDCRVMDGESLSFQNEFDAVIAGVARALRSGGRFVAEFEGHGCCAKIKLALVSALGRRGLDGEAAVPWYFPTVEEYSSHLVKGGFAISYIALIPRPTPLPGKLTDWLETFAESFTAKLPPADRAAYIAEVQETLRPQLCDAAGKWTADYVRLRFSATKQKE